MDNNLPKYVCSQCAGNSQLKNDIFAEEKEKKTCSYCRNRRLCISIDSLANTVDDIYREDYEPSESGDSPSYIISEILELDESVGKLDSDLVEILRYRESCSAYKDVDPMYDESLSYSCKHSPINDGSQHKELWDEFCGRIKNKTRFFNNQLIEWLNDIFLGLEKCGFEDNISPIRTIKPSDSDAVFYRARYAENAQERIKICCYPTQELSSPPVHHACSGRMNPTGISVFYAAFERETCIAEIRLPVGETAISGQFTLKTPIKIFDLTVFDKIDPEEAIINGYSASIFGDEISDISEDKLAFLKTFSEEISKPIPPHKQELDYMPTQALVEYLAHHYKPKIDAVVYASTQTNRKGKNIVFLNHAAKVINNQAPKSGRYKAISINDCYYISRCKERNGFHYEPNWDEYENIAFDDEFYELDRDKCLSYVEGSLKLHKILAINYDVKCLDVEIE